MAGLIKCKAPGDTVSEIGFQGDKGVWPIVGGQLEVKELTQQVTNADELLGHRSTLAAKSVPLLLASSLLRTSSEYTPVGPEMLRSTCGWTELWAFMYPFRTFNRRHGSRICMCEESNTVSDISVLCLTICQA